ncbi:MAG TPA: hypothetical protein DDW80_05040 [Desulfovibrio sp.]|nr:hypothetical protein [Desulfovibrio sp.]
METSFARNGLSCPRCGARLKAVRGCREVTMRCAACGAAYPVRDMLQVMDDAFEEEVGFVPLDRL